MAPQARLSDSDRQHGSICLNKGTFVTRDVSQFLDYYSHLILLLRTFPVRIAMLMSVFCGLILACGSTPSYTAILEEGDTLPEFEVPLKDLSGVNVTLSEYAGKNVVLVFYRGSWCPYCKSELEGLRDSFDVMSQYASVIAVSRDLQEESTEFAMELDLPFRVLSDPDLTVMNQYGIAFERREDDELPHPTTMILDGDRQIVWMNVAEDYSVRPDPYEIIDVLKKLSGSMDMDVEAEEEPLTLEVPVDDMDS